MKQYLALLKNKGFCAFLWTQFLGALNDNILKIVISMLAIKTLPESSGVYISLIGAVFMIPFFLFSGYAGYAADRLNKRSILIGTKAFEFFTMLLALLSFFHGEISWMLAVLFLMALQTTFFSTAKYGILPEMLPDKELSRANGLVEMSTFFAVILGTALGGFLFYAWSDRMPLIAAVLISLAAIGLVASFGISRVPMPSVAPHFKINPWSEIAGGLKRLNQNKLLYSTVLGIAYFAFLGSFLQMDFLLFGSEVMGLNERSISLLATFLAIGVVIGSLLAGRLSGDKVELGIVPLGSIGMGVFAVMLSFSGDSFIKTSIALCFLGVSGGLFSVPLYAMLQQKSAKDERGMLIGTSNFIMTIGILSASASLWILHDFFSFGADQIILGLGLFTLVMTPFVMKVIPQYLIRFSLWLLAHSVFRIRSVGQKYVPFDGPALLVCNHVSYVDGLLVGACVQRFIRFVVDLSYFRIRGVGRLLKVMDAIPVEDDQGESHLVISRGREMLKKGHVVCIFAEGEISATGDTQAFKRGFEFMSRGLDIPIIPVYIDGLWGTVFSEPTRTERRKERPKWNWPVQISFGAPLPSTADTEAVRQAVLKLRSEIPRHEGRVTRAAV